MDVDHSPVPGGMQIELLQIATKAYEVGLTCLDESPEILFIVILVGNMDIQPHFPGPLYAAEPVPGGDDPGDAGINSIGEYGTLKIADGSSASAYECCDTKRRGHDGSRSLSEVNVGGEACGMLLPLESTLTMVN